MSVLAETTEGCLTIDLLTETHALETFNFLKLCKAGYYFFSPFHSLSRDQWVVCGDPNYPRETGKSVASLARVAGPFAARVKGDFLVADRDTAATGVGALAFLADHDLIGSSFCVSLGGRTPPNAAAVFGRVVEGFAVLDTINAGAEVRLTHIHILHDPFEDPQGLPQLELTPSPYQLATCRLDANGGDGGDAATAAEYNALALELIGDLPHYQCQPSPRTLFVARLNPVTDAASLEVFFGRFGPARANVVTDPKTHRSSCYGFVEFATQQQAEAAYHRLRKGCVIDGRHVYVDFSQSAYRH
ncbi:Peptidyl-prolyl cis-trans isomerase [[Candida] zeylanoides]